MVYDAINRRLDIMPRLLDTKHHLYDPILMHRPRNATLPSIYDQRLEFIDLDLQLEYEDRF